MPALQIPWSLSGPTYVPVRVSGNPSMSDASIRTRLIISTSAPESRISPSLIERLELFPIGRTEASWYGDCGLYDTIAYSVNLEFTIGLMGFSTDRFTLRGISVVAGEEWGNRPGLIVGSDLLRRGRLTVDGAGLSFCL